MTTGAGFELDVLLFSVLRQRAGRDRLTIALPEGALVDDAIDALGREPGLSDLLDRLPVRAALNREYVHGDAPLAAGDELALVPPVSGGAL